MTHVIKSLDKDYLYSKLPRSDFFKNFFYLLKIIKTMKFNLKHKFHTGCRGGFLKNLATTVAMIDVDRSTNGRQYA